MSTVPFIKAHAYGNDFLFIEESLVAAREAPDVARAICDRQQGVGADGLIFFRRTPAGAAMKLFNADGSAAEVSGNGVRCLAAIVVGDAPPDPTAIEDVPFRAFMGEPQQLEQRQLEIDGEHVDVVVLSVGNPQCIVLTDRLDETRFRRLGPALATHIAFPEGTNVEFVHVERHDLVRILIWERGVGPTTASGTGACASGVAAAAFGGADRTVEVVSPGGAQAVEWLTDGIYLTGWAEITARGEWVAPAL